MNIAIQQLAKYFHIFLFSRTPDPPTRCQDIEKGPNPIMGQTENPLPSIPYNIQWSIFTMH